MKHVTATCNSEKLPWDIFNKCDSERAKKKQKTQNKQQNPPMPKILPLAPYRKYAFYNLNITVYFGTFIYSIDTA